MILPALLIVNASRKPFIDINVLKWLALFLICILKYVELVSECSTSLEV